MATSIEGVVTDAATGDPVEDATVTAEQTVLRYLAGSIVQPTRSPPSGGGALHVRGFATRFYYHASYTSLIRRPCEPSRPAPGMAAWWDAADLDVDPGALAEWPDRTNDYDLTQTDGGLQPELQADIVNGLPAVHFDGSEMVLGSNVIGHDAKEQGLAIFAVVIPEGWSERQTIYREENVDGDYREVWVQDGVGYNQQIVGSTGDMLHYATDDELVIFEVHQRDSLALFAQGTFRDSNAYTDELAPTQALMGAGLVGHVCEVIVYDRTLTGPERRDTYRYLDNKWGLGSTPPVYLGPSLIGAGQLEATLTTTITGSATVGSTSHFDADLWKGGQVVGAISLESTTRLELAHTLVAGGVVRATSSTDVQVDGRIALHRVALTFSSTTRVVADGRIAQARGAATLESASEFVADGRTTIHRAAQTLSSTTRVVADGRSSLHHAVATLVSTSRVVASGRDATRRAVATLVSTDELTADAIINSILAGSAELVSTTQVVAHGSLVTETEEETTEVTVREPSVRKRSQRAAF